MATSALTGWTITRSSMSNTAIAPVSESEAGTRLHAAAGKLQFLWPLLCLLIIEIVAFGINVKRVGVYQDEWIYFGKLHFVPHSLTEIISALFWDRRIIVRPLEALHFGPLFFLFWEKPLWYHIVCYVSEWLGACFLFLALNRLCATPVALAGAVLFLVYPTHDATHYYIVASSEHVSATFFTLSLWLYLKGLGERRTALVAWSALAYFASVYNYEQTLPLVVLYPLLAWLALKPGQLTGHQRLWWAAWLAPFLLIALSMVLYRAWLLPSLKLGWHYSTCYSLSNFLSVVGNGLNVSLSPYMFSFCISMARDALKDGLSLACQALLALAVGAVFICLLKVSKCPASTTGGKFSVLLLGAVTLVMSYTIFGFSPEHMPSIDTWRNRVNLCGSLGACLLIAGAVGVLKEAMWAPLRRYADALASAVVAGLAGLFILVDWQFAKPWVVSWQAQQQLMSFLRQHQAEIKAGDSIIIGGITRYASGSAPVVDGVWDFQNLIRTTLNNQNINGTVVTGRLTCQDRALVDRSGTLILGTFPFERMILYAPDKCQWLRVHTRQEFLDRARDLGWQIADSNTARTDRIKPSQGKDTRL
ncbi:MAG TPA: hypothetical protein V6D08_12715 [Candidatus Obscuribacterales bacterium]